MRADYIQQGDSLELMKLLPDKCIDLTITSPPYDNLRTYNGAITQWNFEKFKLIAHELFRITKDGGVVVWNVGDATIKGSETGSSFMQALYFRQCGFNLHDTMIWVKDGGGAIGSNKCYTQNFEYMFVLSKGVPKSIHLIYDKPNKSFGVDKSGVGRRHANGEKKIEKRKESKPFSRRNNWWLIMPQRGYGSHPACFPEQLANDHIISWSDEGDIVFDPFLGSGTTAKMALLNKRNWVGSEISEEYCQLIEKRIMYPLAIKNRSDKLI